MINNTIIENDTKSICLSPYINWEFYKNSTVLITGATGLIGSQLIHVFNYANKVFKTNIKILALVRNAKKAKDIFPQYRTDGIKFIVQNIEQEIRYKGKIDYIIHTANTTSSKEMVENAAETLISIVQGTKNILELSKNCNPKSVVYLSSMEVYGDIPITREKALGEDDYGYINILKPRNSYPEGKRAAECLCASYYSEYKVPVKIARLAQTIGAGVNYNDGRVFAEFARCIVEKRNIVLKTKGETIRSYIYITDAVSAILSMLEKGDNGESYNIANSDTTCSIKEMAEMLCNQYQQPKLVIKIEDKYFPCTTKYYLDTTKYYNKSGWKASVDLMEAYSKLVSSFIFQKIPLEVKKKNTIFKWIFAIENIGINKIITILGFQITINRAKLFKIVFGNKPIQNNKIVFSNYMGNNYGCNPKYITEELLKRSHKYDIVWLVKANRSKEEFPKEVRITDYNTKNAIKELMTAKLWVDNYHKIDFLKKGLIKRDKQSYIQTWHGSLGIKKIEKNADCLTKDKIWLNLAQLNSEITDFWISNSKFETDVYKNSFWNVMNIKEYGHPRNDLFFSQKPNIKQKVYQYFNIGLNKKILLYAPSFREDEGLQYYNINAEKILKNLSDKFSGEWCILIRLHPRIAKYSQSYIEKNKNIINASFYADIQELLYSANILISDYSSCMFDFMLSKKPVFIYAIDIEKYNTERGFYYSLDSTPFPVAQNNKELVQNILNFDNEKYKNEVEQFLKDKGCMEDGHASERVVNLIEEIMNNEQ